MDSGIPNTWLFWTPYPQVTGHAQSTFWPMYKIFTYKRPLIVIVAS